MDADKLKLSITTDGNPPRPGFETAAAPAPVDPITGQHLSYWILSEEERAKGFIRPVRRSYKHVGIAGPKHPLLDLTEEQRRGPDVGYVKFEKYPESESPVTGRYWTQEQLDKVGKGCGCVTTMGRALAETWARDIHYYGRAFWVGCGQHLRVEEFVWVDDPGTGRATDERLGT
jgi:hypothetical protein